MVTICRRPIFSYIEIEIVKLIKRFAANPPAATIAFLTNAEEQKGETKTKEQALDDMLI